MLEFAAQLATQGVLGIWAVLSGFIIRGLARKIMDLQDARLARELQIASQTAEREAKTTAALGEFTEVTLDQTTAIVAQTTEIQKMLAAAPRARSRDSITGPNRPVSR